MNVETEKNMLPYCATLSLLLLFHDFSCVSYAACDFIVSRAESNNLYVLDML